MGAIFGSFISYIVCGLILALCAFAGFLIGKKLRANKDAKLGR